MRPAIYLVISLSALSSVLLRPGPAAGAARDQPSILAGVKALSKPVTYSETKISLGELVTRVAADTGTNLTAAPDVADEPVAVIVTALPARELLEQLAELLGYRWSQRGRQGAWRYEVWQDLASKDCDERLRQAMRETLEKRLKAEVSRYVEMARLPEEEISKIVSTHETRGGEGASPSAPLPAGDELAKLWLAQELLSPVPRALARLLGDLNTGQWAGLLKDREATFSSNPAAGEFALPVEIAQMLSASRPSMYRPGMQYVFQNPGDEELERQREKQLQERWANASGYRVKMWLDTDRDRAGASLSVDIRAAPIQGEPTNQSLSLAEAVGTTLDIAVNLGALQPAAPTPDSGLDSSTEPIAGPLPGARRHFVARARPRIESDPDGVHRTWRLQELLPDVARTYGVQIISDAYWNAPLVSQSQLPTAEPIDLSALLNRLAGSGATWDRRGGSIRIRSRTWFIDRRREIPLSLVRRWRRLWDRRSSLPIDEYGMMASRLSDSQLRTLFYLADEILLPANLPDFLQVYPARYALRLYHSLSDAQREALWQGRSIPTAQMRPDQRALFVSAVVEGHRTELTPLDLTGWTAGSFNLRVGKPFVRAPETPARSIEGSKRLETAWAEAGGISDHLGKPPSVPDQTSPIARPMQPRRPAAGRPEALRSSSGGRQVSRAMPAIPRRAPSDRYLVVPVELDCTYAPQRREVFAITVQARSPDTARQ